MTANKQLQIITEVIREEVRFLIYERKYLKESEFEISKEDLMKSMVDSKGQIFTITFFKRKDGSQRVMNCRYGVRSYLKGGSLPYDPNKKRLIILFDMQKRGYRAVPFDNITSMKIGGNIWKVK